MRLIGFSAVALCAALVSACVPDAQIAIPGELRTQTDRIELTGMGGWERGNFRLGAAPGSFTRHARQTRNDGFHVQNIGGGSFDVAGTETGVRLSGRCGFHEEEFAAGMVTAPGLRLAYGCEFARAGDKLPGGLLLKEVPTSDSILAGRTQSGELDLGGLKLGIRAIHDMEGGRARSGTALGYAFDVGGRRIGAVDINGPNKTVYAPRAPGPEREAVLLASLALSIFWNPDE